MASSIRLVSVERGYDPRDFVLVVFGGAGPLHATALMRELGATKALVPYYPGLGCALGCIMADLKHEFSTFLDRRVLDIEAAELAGIAEEHAGRGRRLLETDRAKIERAMIVVEADMAYEGQLNSVRVGLPQAALDAESIIKAFRQEYQKLYRRLLDPLPVRIVNLRTSVIGMRPKVDLRDLMRRPDAQDAVVGQREVFFAGGFIPTPVHRRAGLTAGTVLRGPAIVESDDTTIMVDPGIIATADAWGNLLLEDGR
jgi:N-methylhydantoinase A